MIADIKIRAYVLVNSNVLNVPLRQHVPGASSALRDALRLGLLHGDGGETHRDGSSLLHLALQKARLLGPAHRRERHAQLGHRAIQGRLRRYPRRTNFSMYR